MKQIQLPRGYTALVDDADYEMAIASGPWHAASRGHTQTIYVQRAKPPTTQYLHNFLTGWSYVDHRNGDGLDNQRSNLRQSTHAQNMANARLRKDSTSGFKGVSRDQRAGRWRAYVGIGGKQRRLGNYDTPEAAALAYDAAARELFGEFARLNFPEASA